MYSKYRLGFFFEFKVVRRFGGLLKGGKEMLDLEKMLGLGLCLSGEVWFGFYVLGEKLSLRVCG